MRLRHRLLQLAAHSFGGTTRISHLSPRFNRLTHLVQTQLSHAFPRQQLTCREDLCNRPELNPRALVPGCTIMPRNSRP